MIWKYLYKKPDTIYIREDKSEFYVDLKDISETLPEIAENIRKQVMEKVLI